MTFVQLEFLAFLALVFTAYYALGRRTWQNALLVVASAVFYGWIHPWFLILLYSSALLDFAMGRLMVARPGQRRLWLAISMSGNLGMLGTFKYADFFIENVSAVASALGLHAGMGTLGLFLPVGISFYTFQTMSYTLDVYRGELAPRSRLLDYLVFVSFFPQLVAGPVERASRLLPQVETDRTLRPEQVLSGIEVAMWGAFKKLCVADQIAPYVDSVFAHRDPSGAMIWAATLGFALQILADFSGYTDIARGTARMLGFELMENFRSPYLARNPSDFWKRWHISFSSWIRDYLYIPLGGSRGGQISTLKATFGAMVLSGLWHGASWNFVLWGAYHAALLTGYRVFARLIPREVRRARLAQPLAVGIMFGFTCVGWLIFRERHLDRLVHHLSQHPLGGTPGQHVAAVVTLGAVLFYGAPLVVASVVQALWARSPSAGPWSLPARTLAVGLLTVCVIALAQGQGEDFIYFQF